MKQPENTNLKNFLDLIFDERPSQERDSDEVDALKIVIKSIISKVAEEEFLISTKAFNAVKESLDDMNKKFGKRKDFQEFRIDRLKRERNNFNSLIDKEIKRLEGND